MVQKIGAREAQLRAQREANLKAAAAKGPRESVAPDLPKLVAEASQKKGKLMKRKVKKK